MMTTLPWWTIRQLESQGCSASDWSRVSLSGDTDISRIRKVRFEGAVEIGALSSPSSLIENALLKDVTVMDNARIRNIGVGIFNCIVGADAVIENVASVEFQPEAICGVGTPVSVLDETGSRQVRIFPGISSQLAMLMARDPNWCEHVFDPALSDMLQGYNVSPSIGNEAVIINCGRLLNCAVGNEVRVEGASSLVNGLIINNAVKGRCLAGIGTGVDAENFIVEDGYLGAGVTVRNCYIGQGARLDKGFTAHDSLFFANSSLENGEACAVFSGPYTVSMHKASLLIGCQTSFMNAGSATNQSNHMYKLGPVHWGILERGVKTSSGSYLMLGAKIGAFSLLMGQHKTHPDSSQFPFSYLFGDDRGATVVVPGAMLRSCGLLRDETKWPKRDRRLKRKLPLHDRVIFNVLNPMTVDSMLTAVVVIDSLLTRETDDDRFLRYKGMKFTRASLERAKYLYYLAIFKYLHEKFGDNPIPKAKAGEKPEEWVDMSGLIMPRSYLDKARASSDIAEIEGIFDEAYQNYENLEKEWIAARFSDSWRRPAAEIAVRAADFDKLIEEDRQRSIDDLAHEAQMLKL